jgi:hypothetical protein
MRHFHLQSGEENTAGLPESEIARRLAAGELTPDQPCRLAEEDVWRTVADFFPSGSGLKIRTAKPPASAAEQASAAERIDEPTRRLLLAYGLTDAVNIDRFTRSQAAWAIARREEELRGAWRAHRGVRVGAFVCLLGLGIMAGSTTNPLSLSIERAMALLRRQDGDAKATLAILRRTLRNEAYQRERDGGTKPKPAKK